VVIILVATNILESLVPPGKLQSLIIQLPNITLIYKLTVHNSNPEDGNSCACDYHDGNAPVMFPITGNYGCDEMSVPYTTAVRMADIVSLSLTIVASRMAAHLS